MPKRFDYSASGEFNNSLTAVLNESGEEKQIVLDCGQMDYIDSAGIGLLVMSHKRAMANKAVISIVNIKPSAKEILHLANLQKLIEIK
jgi:anti-sigma B factor antagonist/stage II sporulation protein AA (anti-sigma F factor antagonist)